MEDQLEEEDAEQGRKWTVSTLALPKGVSTACIKRWWFVIHLFRCISHLCKRRGHAQNQDATPSEGWYNFSINVINHSL